MKKTLQLLFAILIFFNCSPLKNSKSAAIKFKNHPNIHGAYDSYKIDNSYNKKQNIFVFIQQKGDFKIKRGDNPEDINIINWHGEHGLKPFHRKSPTVFLNNLEILSTNNNSLYNIRNMNVGEFDEIFITRGYNREIHLYTLKKHPY